MKNPKAITAVTIVTFGIITSISFAIDCLHNIINYDKIQIIVLCLGFLLLDPATNKEKLQPVKKARFTHQQMEM